MSRTEEINRRHEEDLQRLRSLRLMDDDFLTKCFDGDNLCIELILQIILGIDDLKVEDVHTQVFVENLLNRSVRFDVLATDSTGKKYNIEIQRSDKGSGRKRARYNSSMLDVNLLNKGEDFDELPETYVIFITENDVIGKGKALYHAERVITETQEPFGDGAHILYVNGSYRDNATAIGKLMHDFSCTNPSDMYYSQLRERTSFFKESKEGIEIMCKAMEELREQSIQEGRQAGIQEGKQVGRQESLEKVARNMLEVGEPIDRIILFTGLSEQYLKELTQTSHMKSEVAP